MDIGLTGALLLWVYLLGPGGIAVWATVIAERRGRQLNFILALVVSYGINYLSFIASLSLGNWGDQLPSAAHDGYVQLVYESLHFVAMIWSAVFVLWVLGKLEKPNDT